MKWEELSTATANILERCWFKHNSDCPTRAEIKLGTLLYTPEDEVTIANFEEILLFQQSNRHFNVKLMERAADDICIKVAGAYNLGEWDEFNHTLTENGVKEVLDAKDEVYLQYSDAMANVSKCRIIKVTQKDYVLSNRMRIPKNQLTNRNSTVVNRLEKGQVFISRESVYLKQAYERLLLEEQFESLFHLKSVSDDTLTKLIAVLEEE